MIDLMVNLWTIDSCLRLRLYFIANVFLFLLFIENIELVSLFHNFELIQCNYMNIYIFEVDIDNTFYFLLLIISQQIDISIEETKLNKNKDPKNRDVKNNR